MQAVLEHAEASPSGKRMITEMNQLHETLRLAAPPPPAGMDISPDVLPPS